MNSLHECDFDSSSAHWVPVLTTRRYEKVSILANFLVPFYQGESSPPRYLGVVSSKMMLDLGAQKSLTRVYLIYNASSTNSTLCAQPCYHQTVETHSCVSASCQVFAETQECVSTTFRRTRVIYMCMPGAKCDPPKQKGRTCHRMPALAVHYHLVTPYSLGMK